MFLMLYKKLCSTHNLCFYIRTNHLDSVSNIFLFIYKYSYSMVFLYFIHKIVMYKITFIDLLTCLKLAVKVAVF